MDQLEVDRIIAKCLTGQASEGELAKLAEWLGSDSENRLYYETFKGYWVHKQRGDFSDKQAQTWDKITDRIDRKAGKGTPPSYKKPSTVSPAGLPKALKIAATISLIIASAIYFWKSEQLPPTVVELSNGQTIDFIEKNSPPGQKATITLADGSVVKLNADSKIKIPEKFTGQKREVYLEGEAFFDIEKDYERPFVIHTKEVSTIVHGTSFNIKAYPDDNKVQIALVTGSVELRANQLQDPVDTSRYVGSIFLEPTEMVTYEKTSREFGKTFFDESAIAWKDGKLIFKNADFQEIKSKLQRWYGVSFEIKRDIHMGLGYTGEYHNQSLKSVLEGISFSGKFNYEINDKNVVIY